jgi:arsenate reductase (thioredoxin)
VDGTDEAKWTAFRKALRELEARIKLFINLPVASLDRMTLQSRLDAIGKTLPDSTSAA